MANPYGRLENRAGGSQPLLLDNPYIVSFTNILYAHHFTVLGTPGDYTALVPDADGIYEAQGFLSFTPQAAGSDPGSGGAIMRIVRSGTPTIIAASEGMHPGWPAGTSNSPALVLPFNSGGPFEMLAGDYLQVEIFSSVDSSYGLAAIAASLGVRWVANS